MQRIAELNAAIERYQRAISVSLSTNPEQCAAALYEFRRTLQQLARPDDPVFAAVIDEPGLARLNPAMEPSVIEAHMKKEHELSEAFKEFSEVTVAGKRQGPSSMPSPSQAQRRVPPPSHPRRAPWRRRPRRFAAQ